MESVINLFRLDSLMIIEKLNIKNLNKQYEKISQENPATHFSYF